MARDRAGGNAGHGPRFSTTHPFGNGRSHGDSCLAATDHVVALRSLDRFIATDWETGVMRTPPGLVFRRISL